MENNPWFHNYALPCRGLPNMNKILEYLSSNSSLEEVRDYFFGFHNLEAFRLNNYDHLVLPYSILSNNNFRIESELLQPFFDLPERFQTRRFDKREIEFSKSNLKNNSLSDLSEGRVLITHVIPVDVCDSLDLIKYNHLYSNESSCIRKPSD